MAKLLDHEYDGIQEYDNPVPGWLGALFAITIVFGIGYAIYFPAFPGHKGLSGWSSGGQYNKQMEVEEERYAPLRAEAEKKALEALASLTSDQATVTAGKEIFMLRCSPCHGENAEGRVGPSLVDAEWIYGGDAKSVLTSVREGRPKGMPKWKTEMSSDDIQKVVAYVLSISEGTAAEAAPTAEATPAAEATPVADATPAAEATPDDQAASTDAEEAPADADTGAKS